MTVPRPSRPMAPNGPGVPASAQWRDIQPELSAEPYVFAAVELADDHLFVGWEQGEQARALLGEL